jgi:hypothetical protein
MEYTDEELDQAWEAWWAKASETEKAEVRKIWLDMQKDKKRWEEMRNTWRERLGLPKRGKE